MRTPSARVGQGGPPVAGVDHVDDAAHFELPLQRVREDLQVEQRHRPRERGKTLDLEGRETADREAGDAKNRRSVAYWKLYAHYMDTNLYQWTSNGP